jgi:tetratricopeptide (TPR) repeat protein
MLQTRLDALGAGAKRALRAASIFGETFWENGIRTLLGDPQGPGLGLLLEALCEREMIMRQRLSSVRGDTEYTFRHALVRDAAYAMLTEDDRRTGHLAAGSWLEATGGAEPRVLAGHYERGGERAQAAPWYQRAAVQALEGNDLEGAIESGRHALRCADSDDRAATIQLTIAEAHYWKGEMEEAEQLAKLGAERFAPGTDDWFHALAIVSTAAGQRGFNDVVARNLALVSAHPAPHPSLSELECLVRASSQLVFAQRASEGVTARARVEEIAAAIEPRAPLVDGWLHRSRAEEMIAGKRLASTAREYAVARDAFLRAGAPRHAALMEMMQCYALSYFNIGDPTESLTRLIDEAGRLHLPFIAGFAWVQKVTTHMLAARYRETIEVYDAAATNVAGSVRLAAGVHVALGVATYMCGDYQRAEAVAREALALNMIPELRANVVTVIARCRTALGRPLEALELLNDAPDTTRGDGFEPLRGLRGLTLVEALHAAGDREGAKAALVEALGELALEASYIDDVEIRRRFLARPAIVAELLALARAWDVQLDSILA